jgi:GTP-binding protein
MADLNFIDQVHVFVKAGDGGAGCMSFRREAYVPKGGPDGGDGGGGGNIVLRGDGGISSLVNYRFKHHYKAQRGTHGQGARKHGADGANTVLPVPLGTQVYAYDETTKQRGALLGDLTQNGQELTVAYGGIGGLGNTHFTTSTRRAPAFAQLGEPGEERWLELEMKLMADAALIGMPSVGKSSMIAHISAARPKIADYPFTTLVPNLGVVKQGEHNFVVADIPGLIPGAAAGKGLGHAFLRHIERSAVLLHVLDLTGGYEGRSPIDDFQQINQEMHLYDQRFHTDLGARPQIILLNKIDMPDATTRADEFESWYRSTSSSPGLSGGSISSQQLDCPNKSGNDGARQYPIFRVSAVTGQGVREFVAYTATLVRRLREEAAAQAEAEQQQNYDQVWEYAGKTKDEQFQIRNLGGDVFAVHGKNVDRMVIQTEWDNDEAILYLQRQLKKHGVEAALTKAGATYGSEIRIAGRAFTFEPGV